MVVLEATGGCLGCKEKHQFRLFAKSRESSPSNGSVMGDDGGFW